MLRNLNRDRNSDYLACCLLSNLVVMKYSSFQWYVMTETGEILLLILVFILRKQG